MSVDAAPDLDTSLWFWRDVVGLEEVGDGIWNIVYYRTLLARWDERVLDDYVAHGTREEAGRRVLAFDRDVETAIYNTLPDNLGGLVRRIRCPVAFIGGLQSQEIQQVGLGLTMKITQGRMTMMDGSHLFPMEKPVATAAAIEAALRGFDFPH